MKVNEIRPHTTYIGHGGLLRKVKSVSMDIAGGLSVQFKAVKLPKGTDEPTWGIYAISDFAEWAISVKETLSDDLKHYVVSSKEKTK